MGGFSGGIPIAGWVYKGTSHLEMDDDWGYPHDLGKPPNGDVTLPESPVVYGQE